MICKKKKLISAKINMIHQQYTVLFNDDIIFNLRKSVGIFWFEIPINNKFKPKYSVKKTIVQSLIEAAIGASSLNKQNIVSKYELKYTYVLSNF